MKLNIPGVYYKNKPLGSGMVQTYYYHRTTGKRLPDDLNSPEFHIRL